MLKCRILLSATDLSTTKWDGIVYNPRDNSNDQAWWYQNRNDKLPHHAPGSKLNHIEVKKSK